ncbi:MAG: hypothetical protein GOP50_07265 [Candidatus Heimdallarchaeota archaeon]|nr:hypothetical protein [Candidatus Heimdallarchaeota archaeon]
MPRKTIKAAPDYLPIGFFAFFRHFFDLFTIKTYDLWMQYEDYYKQIGYSCRSLFEICMMYFDNEDVVVATTPLHHTSFRNILERFVKPENIHIIELNEECNGIGKIPNIKHCDLVVITHLFGQDMDLSVLSNFKKKHNCLILEDRVQGGTLDKKFCNEVVDVAIYSMGMDKRPVALGGGFMYIDNKHQELIQYSKKTVEELPREKLRKRFVDLLKKVPTYFFYNSRIFLSLFLEILLLISKLNKNVSLLKFAKSYRTKNPGFSHFGYMLKPSDALLKSMYMNFDNYKKMEALYTKKYGMFYDSLSPEILTKFFPWYRGDPILTPYNTILIENLLVDEFLEFLTDSNISCITNPTYKMFNFPYKNDQKDIKFNDGIVYIPTPSNMKKWEIELLTDKIEEFYEIKYAE